MTAVLLAIGGVGVGAVHVLAEDKPISDRDLAARVEQRIHDWQIKTEERPFDAIGWAKDVREAERLAREHHRPIFLFTHDGRMGIGRC
jgi:hypothetical protein